MENNESVKILNIKKTKRIIITVVSILALVGYWTAWYLLPLSDLVLWLHRSPGVALLAFLFIFLLALEGYLYYRGYPSTVTWTLGGILVLMFVSLPIVSVLAVSAVGNSLRVVYLDRIPNLYGVYRIVPLTTAYAYASDKIQSPTHTIYLEESYVYYNGTRPVYNWIIEPEGFFNAISREPLGAIFVYGDSYPPEVKIVKQRLAWGLHNVRLTPLFADTLEVELILKGAFGKAILFEDSADVLYKGKVVQAIPIVDYRVVFPGGLPTVKAYAIVWPNGTIDIVKPEWVRRLGIPVLPERVAREWVEGLKLKDWVQAVFFHNTFIIRDVGHNPQPYLLLDDKGNQWWVFVAEPPGNTYSAYMLILINASSTEPVVYVYKLKRPEIGVSKVRSYVMKAHPNWAWDQLVVQEPLPSYLEGSLLWKVSVTTSDSRGLISVDFLNASSGNVISFPVKDKITAEDVLRALISGRPTKEKKLTVEDIIRKIEKIKKELDELERMLRQLNRSRTT